MTYDIDLGKLLYTVVDQGLSIMAAALQNILLEYRV